MWDVDSAMLVQRRFWKTGRAGCPRAIHLVEDPSSSTTVHGQYQAAESATSLRLYNVDVFRFFAPL